MPYYVWNADIRYFRHRIVRLDLDWKKGFPPSTTTCESLRHRLPPSLSYRLVPMNAPLLDQMWSASSFDVYSIAGRQLLRELGAAIEELPATIQGAAGRIISTEYAFVQFLACVKAVDWERSDVDGGTSWQGEPYVRNARHLVLREEVVLQNIPAFRLDEKPTALLVSEDFRTEWERRGLTGAYFRSLDDYPQP